MEDDQTDPEMVLLVLMERAFKGPTHEGVRILDWAPQLKRVLKCVRENDPMTMELRGEIERLRAELEASETELRIVRASQAESNAEIESLRAELETVRDDMADSYNAMLRQFDPAAAESTDLYTWITCLLSDRARLQRDLAVLRDFTKSRPIYMPGGAWRSIRDEEIDAALEAKKDDQ